MSPDQGIKKKPQGRCECNGGVFTYVGVCEIEPREVSARSITVIIPIVVTVVIRSIRILAGIYGSPKVASHAIAIASCHLGRSSISPHAYR